MIGVGVIGGPQLNMEGGYGVSLSQYTEDIGIFNLIATQSERDVWADPFLIGRPRATTNRETIGVSFSWEEFLDSNLSFQYGYENFDIDKDIAGHRNSLLKRDGRAHHFVFSYEILCNGSHCISTDLIGELGEMDGDAESFKGGEFDVTHLYDGGGWELETIFYIGKRDYDAVIIGGGISGLTAAYLLSEYNILVLEKEPTPGGRVISGEWENFSYPKGMEYIGKPDRVTRRWFDELGLEAVPYLPPTDAIAFQGNIHYGENILDFLQTPKSRADFMRLENELNGLNNKGLEDLIFESPNDLRDYAEYDGLSVGDWLQKNDYDPVVQRYVDVENRGIFGAGNQDLSLLYNIPEMAYNMPDPDSYDESEVYSFPKGMFEVVEALAEKLGARLQTGVTVREVRVNPDKTVSVTFEDAGKIKTIQADSAILTTPAPVTSSLVTEGLSRRVHNTLKSVSYGEYVTLNLFTTERVWKDAWTMSCLDNFFVTLYDAIRLQVPLDYNGPSVLGVYIAPKHAKGFSLLAMSDQEILERCLRDIEKYYPDIRNKVAGYDVQRFKYAFPVFEPNYHKKQYVLNNDESVEGPLFLAGDYMVYATFDGAAYSGYRASKKVMEYL